ncbi:hypothetical protein [Kitasatospora sp. NPDC088548]|uniref:hypothetical protein n=1 Tax=Kitasatospora sp. NPDC088548 TaxID=3364075 RepID=UPI0038279BE3
MGKRPDPVECEDFDDPPATIPHGAPLLSGGKLVGGYRDATFVSCPDVYSIKARHIVVMSHEYNVAGGERLAAAACDPRRIAIDTSLNEAAAEVHSNARCRRPGCRQLFVRALAEEE